MNCVFENCTRPVVARGLCCGHYQQNRRGKPLADLVPRSDEERFWERVDKNGPVHSDLGTRCWIWTGARTKRGYGFFSVGGKTKPTHRFSWEIENGDIPEGDGYHGTRVLHHCDNPPCVNPAHLFLGSNTDNVADCVSKGRNAFGTRNRHAKIDENCVVAIRNIYRSCGGRTRYRDPRYVSQQTLARWFGITVSNLARVISGNIWAERVS